MVVLQWYTCTCEEQQKECSPASSSTHSGEGIILIEIFIVEHTMSSLIGSSSTW